MSLLDADIHSAHPSVIIDADAMFSEDISYFGYPSFRRSSLSRLGSSRGTSPLTCDGMVGFGDSTVVSRDGALNFYSVLMGVALCNLRSLISNLFFFFSNKDLKVF